MKIIRIKNCYLCPFHGLCVMGYWCTKTYERRSIEEHYKNKTLPDWCPLEDEERIRKEEFIQGYLSAWNIPNDDPDEINEVAERAEEVWEEMNKKDGCN